MDPNAETRLTRRGFLHGATILAISGRALALESAVGPTSAPAHLNRKFKICLNPGMIGIKADLNESISLAQQFGFEAIEPQISELRSLAADGMRELKEQLKSKGLVWGATGTSMLVTAPDEQFNDWLAKLADAAAVLQRAGASRLGTWITPGDNRLTYAQQFQRLSGRVKQIAKVLDDHGVRFGLEYLGPKTMRSRFRFEFIHTMAQMRELIAHTGARNVGLIIDSWHWYNAQESPADIRALRSEDVVWVHLNDAPAGVPLDQQVDNRRALPAATGVIDIGGFLGALIDIAYDGPVSAEPFDANLRKFPREEVARRAIESIKRALGKAPEGRK